MSNALTDKQKSLIKLWETQFPKFNEQQVNLFFKLFDLLGFIRDYPLTTTSKRQFVKPSVIFAVFDSVSSDLDHSMNIIEMANIIQTNEFIGLEYAINTLIDNGLVQYSSERESTVANPGPFYKRVYNTSDISDKLKKLDNNIGYYEAEVINSNSENEVLFEYFKRIKDLDNITANIALDEKTIVLDFFTSTLDLPCFWSKDHRRFRQLLTDWYTAQRTMISKAKNLNDIYSLNNNELNELISSFGFPYPHEISTRKKAIFLSNLIQMYKYKGTPRTFVQALEYFDFNDIVLSEWYIDVNEKGIDEGFVARSVPVYPRSEKNNELLINTMPYENFIESDSLWYLDNTGIVNSNNTESIYDIYNDSNTKIKLPSLTSIISVVANANIQNIKVDLSILHRKLQESFEYLVSNIMEFVYLDSTNTYIDLYVGNQFDSTSVDYYINGLSYADNTDRVLIYISENYNGNDYSDFKNCLLYKYNINGKTNKNPIKTNNNQQIFSKIFPKYVQTFKTRSSQVKYHFYTSDFSLIPDDYYPDTYFVYNGEQYIPLIGLFNSSSVESTLKNSFYNSLVLGNSLDTTSERIDLKSSLNKEINLSINYETSFSLLEVYLVIDYLLNIQSIINPDTEEVRYLYNKDNSFSSNSLMEENIINECNRFFQYSNKKNLPFDINSDDISDNVDGGSLNSGSFDKIRKEYDSYIHLGDTRKKKMISAFYDDINNTYYPLGYYMNIPNEYINDLGGIIEDGDGLNYGALSYDYGKDIIPQFLLDLMEKEEDISDLIADIKGMLFYAGYSEEYAEYMARVIITNIFGYFYYDNTNYDKRNIDPYSLTQNDTVYTVKYSNLEDKYLNISSDYFDYFKDIDCDFITRGSIGKKEPELVFSFAVVQQLFDSSTSYTLEDVNSIISTRFNIEYSLPVESFNILDRLINGVGVGEETGYISGLADDDEIFYASVIDPFIFLYLLISEELEEELEVINRTNIEELIYSFFESSQDTFNWIYSGMNAFLDDMFSVTESYTFEEFNELVNEKNKAFICFYSAMNNDITSVPFVIKSVFGPPFSELTEAEFLEYDSFSNDKTLTYTDSSGVPLDYCYALLTPVLKIFNNIEHYSYDSNPAYYRVFVRKPEESNLTFGFFSDYEYLDRNYPQLLDDTGKRTYSIEHMTPVYTYVSAKYYQNYKLNKFRDNFTSVYCRNTQELMNAIYDKKYYSPFKSLEDLYIENNQRFYHYKDSFRSMMQTYGPKFFDVYYSGYREDLCYKYITDAYEGFNIHATGSGQLLKALNPDLLYDIERELSMLQVDFDPSESLLKLIENVVNDFEYYCKYYYDLPYLGGISNLMVGVSIYDKIKEIVDFFKPFRARFRNFTVHYNFDNPLEDTSLIDDYIREKKTIDIMNGDGADYVTRDIINKNYIPVSERLFIPDNNKLPQEWYLNPVESLVNYRETEVLLASSYYDLTNVNNSELSIKLINHIVYTVDTEMSDLLDYVFYLKLHSGFENLVKTGFPDYLSRGKFFVVGINTIGSDTEVTILSESPYISTISRKDGFVKLFVANSVFKWSNGSFPYEKVMLTYGYKRGVVNTALNLNTPYIYENGEIPETIRRRYLLCRSDIFESALITEGEELRSTFIIPEPLAEFEDILVNYNNNTDNYYYHLDSSTLTCAGDIKSELHVITEDDINNGYFELDEYPIIPMVGPTKQHCISLFYDSTQFYQDVDFTLDKDEDKDYPFVGTEYQYPDSTSGYFNRITWNSGNIDLEEDDIVEVRYIANPLRTVQRVALNLNFFNYNDDEENKWINAYTEFIFYHDLDNEKIGDIYIEYGDDNYNADCFDYSNVVYPNLEITTPINDGLETVVREDGTITQTLMGENSFLYHIEKSYRKLSIKVYGSAACDLMSESVNKLAVFFAYDSSGSEENIYGYNYKLNKDTIYEYSSAYENIYIYEITSDIDSYIHPIFHHNDGKMSGSLKDGDRWGNLDKEYIDESGNSNTYYSKYTPNEISQINNYNRNYKNIRDNHWNNYQNQNIDQIKLNYLNSIITIDDFNNDRTGSYDLPRGDYVMAYTPVTNPNGTIYYKRSVVGANMALKNEPFYYGTKQNVINLIVEKDSEGNPISIKEHFAYNYPGTTLQYVNENNDLSTSVDGWVFDPEYYSFIDGTGILCDFTGVGVSDDIVLEYDYDDLYIESSEPIVFQYDIDIDPTNILITEKHICAEIIYLDGSDEKSIFMYISQFYDGNSWSGNDGNVYRVLPSFYNNETNTYYITISKIRIYPVEDITEDNDVPLIPHHVDELGVNSPGFGAYIKNIGFAVEKIVDSQSAQLYLNWFRYPHSVTQHLLDSTGSPVIDYNGNKVPLHMFDRLHTSFLQRFGYQSEGPNLVQPWDINPMNDTRWRSADYRQYEKDIMLFVGKEYKGLTTDYLTFTLKPTYVEADTFKHGMIKYLPYSDTEILNVTQKFDRGITDDQTFTKRVIRFKEFYNNNYTHLYLNGLYPNEDFDLSYFLNNEYSDDVYPGQQGDIPIFDINYMSDPFLSTVSFSIGRQLSKGTQTINMGRLIEKENQTKWPRKEYRQLLNSLGQIYTYNYNFRAAESDFHVNTVNTIFVEAETRRSDILDCGITYDNGKVFVKPVRGINDSPITKDTTSWYTCTFLNENPYFNDFTNDENYLISSENYMGGDFSEYGQLSVPDIPYNFDGKYGYVYVHYTQNKYNDKRYIYVNEGYNNYFANPPIYSNTRNYVLLGITGNYYRFKKDKNEYFYTGKEITTMGKNELYTYTDTSRTIELSVDYNIDSEIPIKIEMNSGNSGIYQRITTHNTDLLYSAYAFQTMPLKTIVIDSKNEDIYFIGIDDNRYEIDGSEIGVIYPYGGNIGDPITFPTITRERPDITFVVSSAQPKTIDINWTENDFSETVVELDSCPVTIAAPTAKIEIKPEYNTYDYLILACKLSLPGSSPVNPYISFGLLKDNSNTANDYYIETLNRCYCDEFHQNIRNIQ